MGDHDALVKAWETYHKHHHKGTAYDYSAFSDALRPFVGKVQSDFDALAAELAACQARCARLRQALVSCDLNETTTSDRAWRLIDACERHGDLAAPDAGEGKRRE